MSPYDEPVFQEARILIRALVQCESAPHVAGPTKVALLLRRADWNFVRHAQGPIKVLQAALSYDSSGTILDCTGLDSAVVSAVPVVHGETLQTAEFFSGGFAGWSQASYILHRQGVPLHTRWSIDVDEACWDMQQCSCPAKCQVLSLDELDAISEGHAGPIHLCADVRWGWWVRILGRFPVQVLCVSSPCQPWSRAGSGSGLESIDGQLLLRVADIAAAFAVPVVLVEQVENFPLHVHNPLVLQAWEQCGYTLLWCAHANLRDVLPGQRNRFLMVFGLAEQVQKQRLDPGCWAQVRRQSLAIAHVPFALPSDMRASCLLSPEVLEKYMDPWLVPTPRRAGLRPQTPVQYRVKKPCDCAGVFVAQYQFQHELSPRMLETQGLLGCLFSADDGLRFFAGPEIAAVHGLVLPLWLSHDARTQMRLLGNAIAVPHAAALLAQACRLLQASGAPEMAQAVHWCLQRRIHARNALLIPARDAWVLCSRDQAPLVFAALQRHAPQQLSERKVSRAFQTVTISCPNPQERFSLQVPPGMPISQLYTALGCKSPPTAVQLPSCVPWCVDAEALHLPVASSPQLNCGGFIHGAGSPDGWCVVLTEPTCYIVDGDSPRTWSQLLRIFDDLHDGPCDLGIYATTGQRLTSTSSFGTCIVALPEDVDLDIHSLRPLAPHVPNVRVRRYGSLLSLQGAGSIMGDLLLGVPFHLLDAFGWDSHASDTAATDFTVTMWPRDARAHMPVDLMHEQWRLWLLTALIEQEAQGCQDAPDILVEVQLVAKVLWSGLLPGTLPLEAFSRWWQCASDACGLPSAHRVFSGPFPQEIAQNLAQVAEQAGSKKVLRKSGALLITLHPSISGGGVKDENNLLAKTKVAALFLDRGVGLPETTLLVDSLVPKLGTAACLKALGAGDTAQQWQHLQEAASSVGIVLPAGDNRIERAAKRLQRAVRRRRLDAAPIVKAADFRLEPGSWVGIDYQPVPILDSASHACTGAFLLDAAEATGVDLDLLRNIESEALCVVVPGHACPDPDSCNGRVSCPVTHRESGHRHLIAACFHNLGETSIQPHVAHGSDVTVQGHTCCTFTLHQDDFPEATWRGITKAPVRAVTEAFQARSVLNAIHGPWGRSFKAAGRLRPSQPQLCDQCSFLAKVPDQLLKSLLQQSGFNNVFVVPRSWDRQLLPGWAVVWIPGSRADVEKQVSLLAEQHGLVRARNRYGVRVPTSAF